MLDYPRRCVVSDDNDDNNSIFYEYNNVHPKSLNAEIAKGSEGFVVIDKETLDTREAYSPDFVDKEIRLAKADIFITTRSKHNENKNITHEPKSAPKPMSLKAKTLALTSFASGHLKAPDGGVIDYMNLNKGGDEVAKMVYGSGNDKEELFVTFERQSLNYIQAQIESEFYKIESIEQKKYVDVHGEDHEPTYHILIRDLNRSEANPEGDSLMIRLSEFGEPTWKRTPVYKMNKRFENKISSESSKKILPMEKQLSLDEQFAKIAKSKLFNNHRDDTVKLLRYSAEHGVNENPNILSDEKGYPIRGDVDVQNTILPDSLPPVAFELLALSVNPKDQNKAENLINKLMKLGAEIDVNFLKDPKYAGLIQAYNDSIRSDVGSFRGKKARMDYKELLDFKTSNTLDTKELLQMGALKIMHAVVTNKEFANAMVASMGSISLFGAGMVMALGMEVLHGPEAGTPIYPENLTLTNMQNPSDRNFDTVFQVHSEFEYLNLLHKNDDFLKNKIMDFNPCWFVEAPVILNHDTNKEETWRKDLPDTKDAYGKMHVCANLKDQNYSIELWKLLFEKQLLLYKKAHPEQYDAYVKVLLKNFDAMISHPMSKKKEGLVDTLTKGKEQASTIINNISRKYDEVATIDQRLADIKKITAGDENTMKANLEASSHSRDHHRLEM